MTEIVDTDNKPLLDWLVASIRSHADRLAAMEARAALPAPFRAEEFGISEGAPICPDPTSEGSAYQGEPAQELPYGLCHVMESGRSANENTRFGQTECGHRIDVPLVGLPYFSDHFKRCPKCKKIICDRISPEPWNEESSRRILALVEERDRFRDLATRKTTEAEENLVRAVQAERRHADLVAGLGKMIAGVRG